MNDSLVMRPATWEDKSFVDDLLFTTMRHDVEATWPNDPVAQRHYFEINRFDPSNTRIVQLNGNDIGRISTTLRPDCLFVDGIHILPEYQHRGIGKKVVKGVFAEAREKNLPVRATVLKVNLPSLNGSLSIGFEVVEEKDHRLHIQYLPAPYDMDSYRRETATAPSCPLPQRTGSGCG